MFHRHLIRLLLLAYVAISGVMTPLQAAEPTPNLDQINQRGSLKVGLSTFVPWAMRDKQGQLIGFEVDVARRLATDSGWQVEFVPTAWDGIIPALLAGKFDVIIGGMTITPERSKSVLFSAPYSHSGNLLLASKTLAGDKTLEQFNSRRIKLSARRGATTVQVAKAQFPKARILQFDDDAQALQEVLNGNAHGFISTANYNKKAALKHADKLYLPSEELLVRQDEGFAVRLDELDKKHFFDNWIAERRADGWLAERYQYWFVGDAWRDQIAQSSVR
ncbi:transporter substrate-binding domain-containing protein [Ferrimonas senticii]|uniref:transporter substrate-binding domain-containing protein n=1 Tax=Ferrimonas senticii TaxID=394566 RepID=UPI0003FD3FEA|nr:transporter substrate-binding domain-containing protein [Ferrimonas senticii]